MAPKDPVWPMDEHTRGKHLVLDAYLDRWLAILGSGGGRIVFIDGFAGPGVHTGGEPGSPIIALRAFKGHVHRGRITAEVSMVFIEESEERCEVLRRQIAKEEPLPPNVTWRVQPGQFDQHLEGILGQLEADGKQLAPCFMMVDPFGVEGLPFALLKRFLAHPKTEVLMSVMVAFIDRFDSGDVFPKHLDDLFGTPDWRKLSELPSKDDRYAGFLDLYGDQLRTAGVSEVLRFDLFRGQSLVYSFIHGAKHHKASGKKKEAMWKASPGGDFAFRGAPRGKWPSWGLASSMAPTSADSKTCSPDS